MLLISLASVFTSQPPHTFWISIYIYSWCLCAIPVPTVMSSYRKASSATSGFFQELPSLPPQYTAPSLQESSDQPRATTHTSDDKVFSRILELYLPPNNIAVTRHVHSVARLALEPSMLVYATEAETNHPVLRPLSTFGEENKNDPLWTTSGWRRLKEVASKEGLVAVAYEKANDKVNRRIYEFALSHVWSCTGTNTGCPMSMTDGAATLLSRHLKDNDGDQLGRLRVFEEAYRRLTSRDPQYAWTSGQWMTERTGGSDVSETETLATRMSEQELARDASLGRDSDAVGMPLGPWSINGFKWFSSATDSEMSIVLARTSKGGLSAFYVPMRRRKGRSASATSIINTLTNEEGPPPSELNGIRIQRLKNKLGTKSLPTAELELKGSRGWLIGTEGQGIKEISAVLNITRLSTAAGSVASWSRGLAICRAYSKIRKVRGGLLQDNPSHLRWMSDETVKYWAGAHFAFLGVALQGASEQDWDQMVANTKAKTLIPREKSELSILLRLLLPVMKAQISVASVHGLRQCMECLGGVGYCENNEDGGLMSIAKIYRDNLVNPIWEGTVSVMAEDVVRVLTDRRLANGNILENVFVPWINRVLESCMDPFSEEIAIVKTRLQALLDLIQGVQKEELLYRGRDILEHIEVSVSAAVLMYDAVVNPSYIAQEVAIRWIQMVSPSSKATSDTRAWRDKVKINKGIFLGSSHLESATTSRL
jgi:alkylation response protein AidB-like acyl-CoA dehydrogenase